MDSLHNDITSEHVANGDNAMRFRAAVNTLAQKWCHVPNAFSAEQADEMLRERAEQDGSEDLAVARMCQLAYGIQNITVKDALLIADDEQRQRVADCGAALPKEENRGRTMARMIDILVRRWHDFDEREKATISSAVVVLEALKNDTGTTT